MSKSLKFKFVEQLQKLDDKLCDQILYKSKKFYDVDLLKFPPTDLLVRQISNQIMLDKKPKSKKSMIKSIMKPFSKLDRFLFEIAHDNIRYAVENEIIYSVDDFMIYTDLIEDQLRGQINE